MSDTSLSSVGFIRAVAKLKDPAHAHRLSVDVDEIFASGDIRKKLASKLVGESSRPTVAASISVIERAFSSLTHSLSTPSVSTETSFKSIASVSSIPPKAPQERSLGIPLKFAPWRVFLNCVDTFNCKHIAHFLAGQKFRTSKSQEEVKDEKPEEMDEAEVEMEGEEEEEKYIAKRASKRKSTKEEIPKTNYLIFGTLLDPNGKYDIESVQEAINNADVVRSIQVILTCGFIVYDISRHPNQIEEARWALHKIERHLEEMEKADPDSFKELKEVRTFILVSTFMTWARTRPVNPDDPRAAFRDRDFKKRKCHPNFKKHFALEKEVIAVGKRWPEKYRTLVLCSGVQYGYEEDSLNFLFKLAWENEPALPLYFPGKNYIPLIHVRDLSTMLYRILEKFPKRRYLLAVEQNFSTLKNITKAISKSLTTGDVVNLPNEDMRLLHGVSKQIFDFMSTNIRMEPTYFLEKEKIEWTTDAAFPYNINNITAEFIKSRRLIPKKVLMLGPPASGKTTLSKKICGYYQLHYLTPETIAERSIETLKYRIKVINAKEKTARKAYEVQNEEESAEEESIEEEEESVESIEALTESLHELEHNMEKNDGKLDEKHLITCLRTILASPPIRNQGYLLDGFPETVEQLTKVFLGTRLEDNEEEESVEEEETSADGSLYPEYIVGLEASDQFILKRVMALPQTEIEKNEYQEELIKKRLELYHADNTEDSGILNYLDEREIHPITFSVEDDQSSLLEDTFQKLVETLGEHHKFGLSPEQRAEEERLLELKTKCEEDKAQTEKEQMDKKNHEEQMRMIEQWARVMTFLGDERDDINNADALPLRHYLMRHVMPTLIRGLVEVSRVRPLDPLDYLAEFLFRENPEGKMLEPEYALESRKLFEEMIKCRDTLFTLTILDKKEQEVFFPPDVKKAAEETELEYDTYY